MTDFTILRCQDCGTVYDPHFADCPECGSPYVRTLKVCPVEERAEAIKEREIYKAYHEQAVAFGRYGLADRNPWKAVAERPFLCPVCRSLSDRDFCTGSTKYGEHPAAKCERPSLTAGSGLAVDPDLAKGVRISDPLITAGEGIKAPEPYSMSALLADELAEAVGRTALDVLAKYKEPADDRWKAIAEEQHDVIKELLSFSRYGTFDQDPGEGAACERGEEMLARFERYRKEVEQ